MNKYGLRSQYLVRPKYTLPVLLGLCVVTLIISLYYLEDLQPKVPYVQLEHEFGQRSLHTAGDGHYDDGKAVVLNDIEIEVANASDERLPDGNPDVEQWKYHRSNDLSAHGHFSQLNNRSLNAPPLQLREKYIIYYCTKNITCCGWGDRQHGILSAYVISLVTNRTFGVYMSSPCPLTNLFHPKKLNWKINISSLHGLSEKYLYTVNDKVFRLFMAQVNFNEVYPQDVVYLTTNYDYFYALKSNPYYKDIFRQILKKKPRPVVFADLWQTIFKLNKRVKRRLTAALSIARPTKSHKLVCAHLRFGKNPTLPWDSKVRNTMDSITPIWDFFNRYRDPRRYRIFVASDYELVLLKAKELYPLQTVGIPGDIIHIDKTRRIKSDPCVGFEKVLADQYLLSMCDVLVVTYSVFGKAAAYMRRSNNDLYFLENRTITPLRVFNERLL